MSRSIHRTRRDYDEALLADYSDSELKEKLKEEIALDLIKKREIKNQTQKARRVQARGATSDGVLVRVDGIPIHVSDEAKYVHYPAGPADVSEILRRLPPGVVNGLASVHLSLGAEYQQEADESEHPYPDDEHDPFLGRRGTQVLPGAWGGNSLGTYFAGDASIWLYAYVYDRLDPMWENFLRLEMLSTLVHEVAHHDDFMTRMGRRRWLGLDKQKSEAYAHRRQYEWVEGCVVPYLLDAYTEPCSRLGRWIEQAAGVSLPLILLAGSWRWVPKKGAVMVYFGSAQEAFLNLVENEDKEPKERRIGFARDLHYGEHYTEALQVLETVTGLEPQDLEALTLRADILEHQCRYEEAKQLARSVVQRDPGFVDAWEVLVDVYDASEAWGEMADAATKGLLCEDGDDYQRGRLLWSRGVARLALGETEAVREDAAELCRAEKPLGRVPGLALLALVELAQHHMDEASRLATEGLQLLGRFKPRADLLAAVQFEAAPKTDKTDALRRLKALRVAPRSRKILLSTGFPWSNEITAAFGLDQGTTRGQATRAPQGG